MYQQTYINLTMHQYLIISIYSYIEENTHKNIRFIYLIYKLYLLILLIISFIIFYHMIDTNTCSKYTYNYITSTQIIKLISLFLIDILI